MIKTSTAKERQSKPKDQIIVALDVETAAKAKEIVTELGGEVGAFKIGLQLFTSAGSVFVRELVEQNVKIFLDLKFHDIPNTVAKAGVEAARLGVWMFNMHAAGGSEMMKRTVDEVGEACARDNLVRPQIIGVTVLTSSGQDTLRETGNEREVGELVVKLAILSAECGLNGVVASPNEIELVRNAVDDPGFIIVTPGIRPEFATNDDQKRVMTPEDALSKGSNYLVIGRPITESRDPLAATKRILADIDAASESTERDFIL